MSASWKLSLPCTRAEAETLDDDAADGLVLTVLEPDPAHPDDWRLEAYVDGPPDAAAVALIRALAPSAAERPVDVERLADTDWVALSQAGLEPIRAGRFLVHAAAGDTAPAGTIALAIAAGRAFGTGRHETTSGCLVMLDALARRGASFGRILDLGTGAGLLAFAALRLWPASRVVASDIDAVAIDVAAGNAAANAIPLGRGRSRVDLVAAPGVHHRRIAAGAPYDLIVANILAAPLIDLAPAVAGALAPGGSLVLAGLLDRQADAVEAAYRRRGVRPAERLRRGDWTILRLRRRGARVRRGG